MRIIVNKGDGPKNRKCDGPRNEVEDEKEKLQHVVLLGEH